jgi:threonine dehydrogenase-like Zn-dependent dehydrogenase
MATAGLPATAMVLDEVGGVPRPVQRPVPAPEPGAVLAEVSYAGICGTDVHLVAGRLPMPTPIVLGHEAVGRVRAVGAGHVRDAAGEPLRIGDRIGWASSIACDACDPCRQHMPTLCQQRRVYGITRPWESWPHFTGGWADVVYLEPGTRIVRLPESVSDKAAIALGCAGPTVVHGLAQLGAPVRGAEVIVQGAGPVGLAAALAARVAGAAQTVLIGGPAARIQTARDLGIADAFVDIGEAPSPADRLAHVRELTGDGRRPQIVVEATGVPAAVAEGIDLCRPGAAYLVLGQYTDHGATPINPHLITRKQLRLVGSWAFSAHDYASYVASLPALLEHADLERLVTVFALSEAERALEAVRAGTVTKAVLAPGSRRER